MWMLRMLAAHPFTSPTISKKSWTHQHLFASRVISKMVAKTVRINSVLLPKVSTDVRQALASSKMATRGEVHRLLAWYLVRRCIWIVPWPREMSITTSVLWREAASQTWYKLLRHKPYSNQAPRILWASNLAVWTTVWLARELAAPMVSSV